MGEESGGGFKIPEFSWIGDVAIKLIDTVKSGIGAHRKAYYDKKDIDNEAYKIKTNALAQAEAIGILSTALKDAAPGTSGIKIVIGENTISSLPAKEEDRLPNSYELDLTTRANERISFQENKRQQNIENITSIAAGQLMQESEVSEEPVDPDWTARFFRNIEDVSNEEMQMIWGKILAGEIKNPGSYSLRTLEVVKSLNKQEANLINGYARRAFKLADGSYAFVTLDGKLEIPILDLTKLRDIGIISSAESLTMNYYLNENSPTKIYFLNFDALIEVEINNQREANIFNYSLFTSVGIELLNLIQPIADISYLTDLANTIQTHNINVKIGKILQRDQYGNPMRYNEIKRV